MTQSQNLRHRRAIAAQRRAPVPEPQLGFDPTAVFGGLTRTKGRGRTTNFFPPFVPTDTTTDGSVPSTTSQPSSVVSSSSTTSSTTPSTTSTSTVVSSTTTPPPPSTTSTTPVVTTLPTTTAIVTVSFSHTTSSTISSSASATSTAEPSSGVSTGAVVGGIGAGIVAIAAIGFAIVFFLRRSRKRDNNFDTHEFRRSAVLLDDPPTHDDTVSRGFNPRPPTMIERHLASPAPTFGTQYGHPGPAYNEYNGEHAQNGAGYGASNYQSFSPGQVISMNNGAPSPISAASAHPMYANPAYGQSPFSPAGQYAGQEYYEQGQPSVGVAAYPVLTRQGSGSSQTLEHRRLPTPTQIQRESAPANDYVDLDRSSVSPYQAEQYQEISRRLNTEVPAGLPTAEIEKDLPPHPSASPFADPTSAPPSPGGQYAIDRRNLERRPVSGESLSSSSQTLEFPVPPSPAHTVSSRYRVDSTPPTLPEILVESRVSVGAYPMARNSEIMSPGLTPGHGSRFPTTPSPLASSFAMPSPLPSGEESFPNNNAAAAPSPLHNEVFAPEAAASKGETPNAKKRGTTYSMYDAEDAYGGI